MFRFSCLGIWWHHNIWIHEKLKFDYLKNEKSFRSEIKNIFPCFTNAFFRYTKQISKNVADVTFKYEQLISGQGSFFLFSIKSSNNQWLKVYIKNLYHLGNEKSKSIMNIRYLFRTISNILPYNHTTFTPRWKDLETTVSTSFQRGIQVVCL